MSEGFIRNIRFDERGLIPAIIQDADTNAVLSLQYLDNASLMRTLRTGRPAFPTADAAANPESLRLLDIRVNEDGGSLTILIEREEGEGPEQKPLSLLRDIEAAQRRVNSAVPLVDMGSMEFGLALDNLHALIAQRKELRPEGSYTTYLFNSGLDKILKKIAEESGEVIIAAKNKAPREIISELADLFYHLMVLMVERDITMSDLHKELARRASQAKGGTS